MNTDTFSYKIFRTCTRYPTVKVVERVIVTYDKLTGKILWTETSITPK